MAVTDGTEQGAAPTTGQQATTRKRGRRGGRRRGKRSQTLRVIHAVAHQRQDAWAEGDHPVIVEKLTVDLDGLYAGLHGERRELFAQTPQLEGRDVVRGNPSETIAA
jgi:hypothetical protein